MFLSYGTMHVYNSPKPKRRVPCITHLLSSACNCPSHKYPGVTVDSMAPPADSSPNWATQRPLCSNTDLVAKEHHEVGILNRDLDQKCRRQQDGVGRKKEEWEEGDKTVTGDAERVLAKFVTWFQSLPFWGPLSFSRGFHTTCLYLYSRSLFLC